MRTIDLKCPGCGAPTSTTATTCEYCGRPVVVTSFSTLHTLGLDEVNKYVTSYRDALGQAGRDPDLSSSLAMCYLKLGLYDQARAQFETAISETVTNSETYFYMAVTLLEGKKPFVTSLSTVRESERYATAAVAIEPRGVYFLLLAYLTADHYERKFLNPPTSSVEYRQRAEAAGVSQPDVALLEDVLRQQITIG